MYIDRCCCRMKCCCCVQEPEHVYKIQRCRVRDRLICPFHVCAGRIRIFDDVGPVKTLWKIRADVNWVINLNVSIAQSYKFQYWIRNVRCHLFTRRIIHVQRRLSLLGVAWLYYSGPEIWLQPGPIHVGRYAHCIALYTHIEGGPYNLRSYNNWVNHQSGQ